MGYRHESYSQIAMPQSVAFGSRGARYCERKRGHGSIILRTDGDHARLRSTWVNFSLPGVGRPGSANGLASRSRCPCGIVRTFRRPQCSHDLCQRIINSFRSLLPFIPRSAATVRQPGVAVEHSDHHVRGNTPAERSCRREPSHGLGGSVPQKWHTPHATSTA